MDDSLCKGEAIIMSRNFKPLKFQAFSTLSVSCNAYILNVTWRYLFIHQLSASKLIKSTGEETYSCYFCPAFSIALYAPSLPALSGPV